MLSHSDQLCGKSLPETDRGKVYAQPQPVEAEARASDPGKLANRVCRSRCSQEESARVETTERFRFVVREVLPGGQARTADRAGPRQLRTARWIRSAGRRPRRRLCSRANGRQHGESQTHPVSPQISRFEDYLRQILGGKRPLRLPVAPNRGEIVDRFQRGMASSDFLWLSIMRSLRRCLMRSSSWPQNFRKYCAADSRALITTSQRRNRPSLFSNGWGSCGAPAIRTATAQTCKTIFVLPSKDAAIVNPSAEAMFRRPRTVNSRPIIITTIQAGTNCMPTRETKAAEISSLSAIGSRRI